MRTMAPDNLKKMLEKQVIQLEEDAMAIMENRRAVVIRSALVTPLCLLGMFVVGALVGEVIFSAGTAALNETAGTAMAALAALICVSTGGALWGRALARIAKVGEVKRMMWAGALGYGPTVILAGLTLTVLENLIVEQHQGPDLPVHIVFTLLFVPAAFLVAAAGASAVGLALKRGAPVLRLGLGSGLAAGIAFLVVDLLLDSLGMRVGAPGAVERATMLTVMFTGNVTASLAAGGVIGLVLSGRRGA